jgi:hypothetical protein
MKSQLSQIAPDVTLASQIIAAQDGTTATSVTLNSATCMIKVSSVGNGVLIRFGAAPTSTAFDDFVVNGSAEYIPVSPGSNNVQFLAITTGATTRVSIVQK